MIFDLTPHLKYPMYRLTARAGKWSVWRMFDSTHKTIEVDIPPEVDEKQVEVFMVPMRNSTTPEPDGKIVVLKTKFRPRRGKPSGNNSGNNAGA